MLFLQIFSNNKHCTDVRWLAHWLTAGEDDGKSDHDLNHINDLNFLRKLCCPLWSILVKETSNTLFSCHYVLYVHSFLICLSTFSAHILSPSLEFYVLKIWKEKLNQILKINKTIKTMSCNRNAFYDSTVNTKRFNHILNIWNVWIII